MKGPNTHNALFKVPLHIFCFTAASPSSGFSQLAPLYTRSFPTTARSWSYQSICALATSSLRTLTMTGAASGQHTCDGDTRHSQAKSSGGFVGSIDQGTTSSRFFIFDTFGTPIASHQIEFEQLYPQSGWVGLFSSKGKRLECS